jgi:glycosyltransferase involved in cell wall biosynthesis
LPQRFITALNGMFVLISLLNKIKGKIIVHSMQSNVAAIIACIFKRKKIVIRNSENPVYSVIHAENKLVALLATILKLLFYNFTDGIITNSKGSKKSLRYFVFNKKKIISIYNPYLQKINKKVFKKKNYIINIARLRKQKDHKTLLEAFQIFSKKNKKYKLLILGHGNLEYKLKQQCKKLGILDKVIFKGWVKKTEIYLKKSKIFVLSSVYEGLGNVLIDAINFNVPCISTNCPSGPSEILLDGKGGYLCLVKSPIQLAEKMAHSIKNYSKSLKKNSFAKKSLDRFLISSQSKKYFDYLYKFN